jgi:hypothetical protein
MIWHGKFGKLLVSYWLFIANVKGDILTGIFHKIYNISKTITTITLSFHSGPLHFSSSKDIQVWLNSLHFALVGIIKTPNHPM